MTVIFDESGLKIQSLAEIKREVEDSYRDIYGSDFNLGDDTFQGKQIAILAEREALLQETLLGIYYANYRLTAKGVSLDYNLEITGQKRLAASSSVAEVYAENQGFNFNAGVGEIIVATDQQGQSFTNDEAVSETVNFTVFSSPLITPVGGVATVTLSGTFTAVQEDSVLSFSGFSEDYYNDLFKIYNVTQGPTQFSFNVSGSAPANSGSTGTFRVAVGPIKLKSQELGPIQAIAGSLTSIIQAPANTVKIANIEDAILGSEIETDPEVRDRAAETINIGGGGFREAILARVAEVEDVVSVNLVENNTDVDDVEGRPPNSVEVFVVGGTDTDVATGIFNSISAGVRPWGTETVVLNDSQGNPVTIEFSRLVTERIYVEVTRTTNSDPTQGPVYPVTGDSDIQDALAAIVFEAGQDVWETTLRNAITVAVPGIVTMSITFDTVFPPVNTAPISIPVTKIANIDAGDVTVV